MRIFPSGATRDDVTNKPDYEGYISPLVLEAFGKYMLKHQMQADGEVRASDNWQRGMPLAEFLKSLLRHVFTLWRIHRGYSQEDIDEALGGSLFNIMGYWHEYLLQPMTEQPRNFRLSRYHGLSRGTKSE